MPQKYHVLRVLVSSPDDVADERTIAAKLINQVNQILAHHLGIHLEFVGWETSTHPGFGADPQSVITEQIGDDYDIFVGILWTRFGTPTKSAGSGTEDEFLKAYKRYKENPDEIRIMFYFSEAPVVWSQHDVNQMALIQKFRSELPEKGGLYRIYKSKDEFEELLRLHLAQQVQEWGAAWGTGKKKQAAVELADLEHATTDSADEVEVSEPEEGFLDLVESGTEQMETVGQVAERMTEALQELAVNMQRRTESAQALGAATSREDLKRWKVLVEATAVDMMEFVKRMEVEIPLFASSYSGGVGAYGKAAILLRDFGPEHEQRLEEALQTVASLRGTIEGSRDQLRTFRDTISRLPRVSTSFNQARSRTLGVLDKLDREFSKAIDLSLEIETVLANIPRTARENGA